MCPTSAATPCHTRAPSTSVGGSELQKKKKKFALQSCVVVIHTVHTMAAGTGKIPGCTRRERALRCGTASHAARKEHPTTTGQGQRQLTRCQAPRPLPVFHSKVYSLKQAFGFASFVCCLVFFFFFFGSQQLVFLPFLLQSHCTH
jgi:hypothetical protein